MTFEMFERDMATNASSLWATPLNGSAKTLLDIDHSELNHYDYDTTVAFTNDTEDGFVFESYPQRILIASILMTVSTIGILGNSLTILAVLLTQRLQTAINTFVINLAISDLLSCLFIPWSVAGLLSQENPFAGSQVLSRGCVIAGGVLATSVASSFYSLASIALERLILITFPRHTYERVFSRPVLVIWVAAIWTIPFSFVILPPILGVGALGFNPKYKLCSDISERYHPNASQTYDFIQAAGAFTIPFVILVASYSRIIYYVWSNSKNFVVMELTRTPESGNSPTSSPHPGRRAEMVTMSMEDVRRIKRDDRPAPMTPVKRMSRRELRVTMNLFFVFCVFMTCLFPYSLCLIFDQSDPVVPYSAALLLVNCCINPIIYSLRFPNFKVIFKYILKCRWHRIPSPTPLLRCFRRVCSCCRPRYIPRDGLPHH